MIEIAFDKNLDASFQGQEYPLLDVPELFNKHFEDYIEYAKIVLKSYVSERYLIVISDEKRFNANKLALAFFVCSCFNDKNDIDCLVIKNENYNQAFENYKPYVAISIGIRYALRLIKEPVDTIYKELECLDYLNFSIKKNYVDNSICYIPYNDIKSSIDTNSAFDAIAYAALYKILALAKIEVPFEIVMHITKDPEDLDAKRLVRTIIQKVSSYIDI